MIEDDEGNIDWVLWWMVAILAVAILLISLGISLANGSSQEDGRDNFRRQVYETHRR